MENTESRIPILGGKYRLILEGWNAVIYPVLFAFALIHPLPTLFEPNFR